MEPLPTTAASLAPSALEVMDCQLAFDLPDSVEPVRQSLTLSCWAVATLARLTAKLVVSTLSMVWVPAAFCT